MTREEAEARDRLLFHLENQIGFWFALVVGDDPRPRARLREAAEAFCREHGQRFVLHAPLPHQLIGLAAELAKGDNPGLHWIRADGPKGLIDQWESVSRELLVAMNERREAYRRRLDGGVVIEGRESLKRHLRDLAPDLFSIRAFIAEPGTSQAAEQTSVPEWRSPRSLLVSAFLVTADPDRELARAARLATLDSFDSRQARAEALRAGTLGLLMAGRAQEAEPRSRDLAFEAEQLLKEHPEYPGVRMLLQSTRFVQALVAVESNRLAEALPYLDEAQAMLSARAESFSDLERGGTAVMMMGLFEIRGRVLLRLKDLPGAIDSFRKRLEITRVLADSDVSNQEMQIELCSATYALADALKWQGDLTSSESLLRQMAAHVEQRTLEHPDEHHWHLELMRFRRALGDVRAARGDLAEALEENRAAVRLAADLVDRDASDESLLFKLWFAYRGIVAALFAQSEWSEALVAAEQMLIASEKGLKRFHNHDRWGWLVVLGHIQRAELLEKIGDTEGVKAALLDAWTRVSHLPIGSDEMEFVGSLLSLHVSAVDLEKEPDNSAIGLAKRAVKLGERALAVAPDDEPTRRRLELSYRLLSLLLKFCGKLRASRRFRRKASALRRRRARR